MVTFVGSFDNDRSVSFLSRQHGRDQCGVRIQGELCSAVLLFIFAGRQLLSDLVSASCLEERARSVDPGVR